MRRRSACAPTRDLQAWTLGNLDLFWARIPAIRQAGDFILALIADAHEAHGVHSVRPGA